MTELYGEEEVAATDLVQVIFQCRGVAPLTVRVNRNATDEMLERRAQKEWKNNWLQLSKRALAPIPRPRSARQSIIFEEAGMERPTEKRTRTVNVTLDWDGETTNTTIELPLTTQLKPRGMGESETVPGPAMAAAHEYGAGADVWEASMPPQVEDGCVVKVRRKEVRIEIREGSHGQTVRIRRDADSHTLKRAIEVATKRELVHAWVGGHEANFETLQLEEKVVMNIETRELP
jgi:hypothetical protein